MIHQLLFLPSMFFLLFIPQEKKIIEKDLGKYFKAFELEGSFLLYDLNKEEYISYKKERCNKGFLPASTYKIPHSLFALEAGIVAPQDTIYWNGEESWNPDWNKNHQLSSAFKVSCVPCYQQFARKIGAERMQEYVQKARYGHMDIQEKNIDTFWLDGASRISQFEQIDFLTRLYRNQLPFSERNMEQVKEIMIMEQKGASVLRAKTGLATQGEDYIGWFVGYLEKDGSTYIFATNMQKPVSQELGNFVPARKEITLNILKDLGLY